MQEYYVKARISRNNATVLTMTGVLLEAGDTYSLRTLGPTSVFKGFTLLPICIFSFLIVF